MAPMWWAIRSPRSPRRSVAWCCSRSRARRSRRTVCCSRSARFDVTRLLIIADAVLDGTGAAAIRPGRVLIEGERILAVGSPAEAAADVARVEFAGATILPGLIDCHVHLVDAGLPDATVQDADPVALRVLRLAEHARATLLAGVTTVRDVGGRDHIEFGFRRAVREGLALAPRLVLAGKIVSITTAGAASGSGMYRQADGPWEVVKAVREQGAAGADVIKGMATGSGLAPGHERPRAAPLTPGELRAAVATAHGLGSRGAGPAPGVGRV